MNIAESVSALSENTIPVSVRAALLKDLYRAITTEQSRICKALYQDLGKSEFESIATETSIVLEDLALFRKKLPAWTRSRRVSCSMLNWPATGKLIPEPYGKALIFSAWNYPFQLMLSPFIAAIAAGNRVILKPSEQAPATAEVIENLIDRVFPADIAKVINGGQNIAEELLQQPFDIMFYTGGINGGRCVAQAAARQMIPAVLELGGKSPCIADRDADIKLTAKRIVWGKFLNAGQTCVAPDYLFVHESIHQELLKQIQNCIRDFYGEDPILSPDYSRIVNQHHFDRLLRLADGKITPGACNREQRFIAPTIIDPALPDTPLMQEEIFGPILPVMTFTGIRQVIDFIRSREKPLALYYYGKENLDRVLRETSSGSVCVNECVTQLLNASMPFGGVGASGMGAYHGKWGFDTFSHLKPVMKKACWLDLPMRYPPGLAGKLWILKLLTKK